jgi:hypothetical protein
MVKADTRALNLLLPKDLSEWFTDYAKSLGKTKTEIICSLLQGIKNGDAYSDVDNLVDNSVDGIESIVKAYLDKHLQSHVDKHLHGTKQADVVNPVDSDKDVYVDTDVDNPVDSNVDTDVDNPVDTDVDSNVDDDKDNPVDDSETLPIIDAIANIAAPTIEKSLDNEGLSDAIAATDDSTASIELPVKEVVAIATVETLNDETGMNTQEAWLIAQQRGYTGNADSFRSRYVKQGYGEAYGLRRIPHDGGREKWIYFDTRSKTHT